MSVFVSIAKLEKHFGPFGALNGVDAVFPAGSFTAVLGPSGCGKTTLLRLLAGFEKPTSGTVLFDGRVVSSADFRLPPESRGVGMVFQSFALWPHMTVVEHVLFALKHRGRRSGRDEAMRILRTMGLDALADRHPAHLSGGQRQRVSLARAVAGDPGILLMDEPLSALDAELRIEMRQEIASLHRKHGATFVYVTHDQEEAMALADRVVVMNGGRIEQVGTPAEVYTTPTSPFVARFVSKANLIRGRWEDRLFYPEGAEGGAFWAWMGQGSAAVWRDEGVYPIRPERVALSEDGRGLPAEVEDVQYQGRELHCTLRFGETILRAYRPSDSPVASGVRVWVNPA